MHFDDTGINDAFDRPLIVIKNIQNPAVGTFSAATNPFAYKYKNWAHDAAITAIALDASGHYAEAEQYYRWIAPFKEMTVPGRRPTRYGTPATSASLSRSTTASAPSSMGSTATT